VATTRLVKVDGKSNVVVEIPRSMFGKLGLDDAEYEPFAWHQGGPDPFPLKLGAACSRWAGDLTGLGLDPGRWPTVLPDGFGELIVGALPLARKRVECLHNNGHGNVKRRARTPSE
jgi:hypothetical protein